MSTSPNDNLPRPASGHAEGAAPTGHGPSTRELRAEVERARAELGETIDQLTTQLSPGYQATRLADATKTAAKDAGAFLTGSGLPAADERRARNVKLLMAVVAVGAAALTALIVRKAAR